MKHAMERYERGDVRVIPIILRSCAWEEAPFGMIQALPTDAKPVVGPGWHNKDEAFTNVARGVRQVIEELSPFLQQKDTQDSLSGIGSQVPSAGVPSPDPPVAASHGVIPLQASTFPAPTVPPQTAIPPQRSTTLSTSRLPKPKYLRLLAVVAVLILLILIVLGEAYVSHWQWSGDASRKQSISTSSGQGATVTVQTIVTPVNRPGVAGAGSQFVAVGDNSTILTSSDGKIWANQTSSTTPSLHLHRVAWSGSQFVVTALRGTILTSPNGSAWVHQNSGTSRNLLSIVWGDSQFVVVGDGGTILTSSNGITWVPQYSGTSQQLWNVVWGDSQFVVVGDGGTILTSSNGIT